MPQRSLRNKSIRPALLSFGHSCTNPYVGLCTCCGDANNPNDEEICKLCDALNPPFDGD